MVERGRQLDRTLPHLPSQQHDAAPLPLPQRPPPNPRWEGGLLLAPLLLPLLLVLPPLLLPKSNLASKLFQVYNRRKIIFLDIHRCPMSLLQFLDLNKLHFKTYAIFVKPCCLDVLTLYDHDTISYRKLFKCFCIQFTQS